MNAPYGVSRAVLVASEVLMGLAAVGGGLDLALTNGELMAMPKELLKGSPFGSFLIPGLVLLAVGVLNLVGALYVLRRHEWGTPLSAVAGLMWIGWFVVQVAVVGFVNWQQPVYFVLGVLMVALSMPNLAGWFRGSLPTRTGSP